MPNCDSKLKLQLRTEVVTQYHLKRDPTTIIRNTVQKLNRSRPTPVSSLLTFLVILESRSPLLLGRCSRQLRKRCAGAYMVYSRVERRCILPYSVLSCQDTYCYMLREQPQTIFIRRKIREWTYEIPKIINGDGCVSCLVHGAAVCRQLLGRLCTANCLNMTVQANLPYSMFCL
jgi:hypothetical protein